MKHTTDNVRAIHPANDAHDPAEDLVVPLTRIAVGTIKAVFWLRVLAALVAVRIVESVAGRVL